MRTILYTGNGGGKTIAAFGLGMRACGHGQRVIVIQFMKGRKDIGEFLASTLLPDFHVHQFGREGFVDLKNPSVEDKNLAKKGLDFIKTLKEQNPKLVVLDEACLALSIGLFSISELFDALATLSRHTNVVLTGRNAPRELVDRVDIAVSLEDIRQAKPQGFPEQGIEY